MNRYYIGQTMDLSKRLEEHNSHHFKKASTKIAEDWEIFHFISCTSRSQAILIEKHIKRARKRKYLEDLKKYPEIGEKLLERYSVKEQ